MSLAGKVAIVTGGSRGIGRAISIALGGAGAQVVVAARTEVDRSQDSDFPEYAAGSINDTAQEIAIAGGEALPVRCDVTSSDDVQRLVAQTLDHFGRIDIVVSNAGVDCESPVADLDIDLLDRCMAVNIRGPVLLCKYALPHMFTQHCGGDILHFVRRTHENKTVCV